MIELLAPAKDKICAKVAIDYGADAVYMGASSFGARKSVPNSVDDIKEVVEYAHKFRAKVYVAINTILSDKEILEAKALIEKLSAVGVDAFIVQDMGLVEVLKDSDIKLNASTQCDNRTKDKVKFLEDVGFSRVILARELSIEQIKEIKKCTTVELEAFIHGALCVSYSGQCYLSQAIGGRSANRGECAQPCRKKYSLMRVNSDGEEKIIAKDKHLLCLKDFNASKHIKELADAGVTSFKIEGRLKDANYVKNVVAYYRKLIDGLGLKKTSSGQIQYDFEPNLEKSFNRGFTDYFVDGKRKEIFTFDSPKSKGEYLGRVTKVSKDYFEINAKLNPQDGLCFFANGELSGCLVNKSEKNISNAMLNPVDGFSKHRKGERQCDPEINSGRRSAFKIYPNKMDGIKIGTEIYRNVDSEFEKKLKNSKTCRKIAVNIEFNLGKIKAVDEDSNFVEMDYSFEELAQNEEKMASNILTQLKKSGESDFLVEDVKMSTEKIPFLPISKLNELRRDLLEKLETVRINNYRKTDRAQSKDASYPQSEIDYRGNVLNKYAKKFYEAHNCSMTEPALESGISSKGKVVMTAKHCLKYAFNMCKSSEKMFLVDEKGKQYELKFNCDKCEMEIIF